MGIHQNTIDEARRRLGRGDAPASVVAFIAERGGEMMDASRVLTMSRLSLTLAKRAIDESGVWPGRAAAESEILDGLESWDP